MVQEKNVNLPVQGVKLIVDNTRAFIGDSDYGIGSLCVAESNLIWKQQNGNDLCFNYPNIALHAISRDLNAFPHECLYLITDHVFEGENEEQNSEEENDSSEITPIRFVPQDKTVLNALFKAINECQALYPDEMSGDEQEQDENDEEEEGLDDDENSADADFDEANYRDDDDYVEEFKNGGKFYDADSDLNNIELSEKGQQILRRINITYQNEGENGKKSSEIDMLEEQEQYEDADISH